MEHNNIDIETYIFTNIFTNVFENENINNFRLATIIA